LTVVRLLLLQFDASMRRKCGSLQKRYRLAQRL
jgi:hypothetical protein